MIEPSQVVLFGLATKKLMLWLGGSVAASGVLGFIVAQITGADVAGIITALGIAGGAVLAGLSQVKQATTVNTADIEKLTARISKLEEVNLQLLKKNGELRKSVLHYELGTIKLTDQIEGLGEVPAWSFEEHLTP